MALSKPVSDRYRRLERLGEGGAGQVWLVEDQLRPGSRMALKLCAGSPDRHAAFRREFVTLSRLRHPGLVEVHDFDLAPTDGSPRFTLEYVDGEDLAVAVARSGVEFFLEMTAEALRVLAFLHDFGLLHCDLKPPHLRVRKHARLGSRLVLLDLGLAMMGQPDRTQASSGPAGTLPYMAPELFEGAVPDRRTDLYALGTLLHEVVHGRPPLLPDGGDLTAFVEAIRSGQRERPALPEGYPQGLTDWLEALIHPEPSRRPSRAGEALARLNAACATNFPAHTAAGRAALLASDPVPGRDDEYGRLWARLDPRAGPRVIWLTGAAGSGKSRLLRWLRSEAILRDWHVVSPPSDPAAQSDNPVRLLEELRASAARRPTLLLLDELERADGRVIGMLDRVAREGKAAPIQVVAALRPGELTHATLRQLLDHTGTVPTLRRIDLNPLDTAGVRALAERATGSPDISDARLRWLTRTSEGNASLAEALLVEGAWEKGGRGGKSRSLDRSIRALLGLLSPQATRWLEALAAVGRHAPEGAVATLSGWPDDEAREAAQEARTAGLASISRGRWSPSSNAVAAQVLAGMGTDRSVEIHRRAAELLEASDRWERRPARLARLWSAAGDVDRACACAVEAAESSADPAGAAENLAFALRHCQRRGKQRLGLRTRQGAALMAAGHHQAAARAWGAALRLCTEADQRAGLLARQAHALVQAGRFSRARVAAEQSLQLARSGELPLQEAAALEAIGMVLGRLGREAEAIPVLDQALEILHVHRDARTEAETLQIRAACKSRLGHGDAEADFLRAIDLYHGLCEPGSELKSLLGLAVTQIQDGRLDEARKLLEDVRARAVEHGNLDLQEAALSKLASLAIERGELDSALSLSRESLDHARHLGDRNRTMVNRCRLAEALIGCGRPAEAVDLLRDGLHRALEKIEPDMQDYARMLLAHALLEAPSADENEIRVLLERVQEGFRHRRKTRPLLVALVLDMEMRSRPGRRPDPFEPLRMEFDALLRRQGSAVEPEILARSRLALAHHHLHRGDAHKAEAAAAEAVQACEKAGLAAYGARSLDLLGEALERQARDQEARKAFDAASESLAGAAARIADAEVRRNFLDRPVFRSVRERASRHAGAEDRRLLALYEMIRGLNSETDPDFLLESILDMALRAAGAERGMVLLRQDEGEAFSVRLARNLEKETENDAERYSRSIVEQAGAGRSILALDAGDDERFSDLTSVSMFGIRSLMCVPLRSRGRIIGTVYLDSRSEGSLFTKEDLRFIEAFADHAALAIENARERAALENENRRLLDLAEERFHFGSLVGRSPAMLRIFRLIEKVAASELPVLIQGESGTGKELAARAVHFNGARRRRIFLSENCAAIPESLLESELFGHVKGAFTGADRDRAGLFEQADGGTLFLDEVGDMSPAMQARLLRALQEGEIRRVGADRPIHVDVRVIAATHRDLGREVAAGRFREDLLYRLQVLLVRLPPLRERPEDVSLLVTHLLERISKERGRPASRMDDEVRLQLERYEWPGNVRQLENTLQRLVLLAGDAPITIGELESDPAFRDTLMASQNKVVFSLDRGVGDELQRALEAADGNRDRAAQLLGISRATIYRKIKQHGLG